MSLLFVFAPAALVGALAEALADRMLRPKLPRGGSADKFSYNKRRHVTGLKGI